MDRKCPLPTNVGRKVVFMKKYMNHVEPFAVGYLNAEHDDPEYRIACGMRERMKYMPIYIRQDQIFAGYFETIEDIGCRYDFGHSLQLIPTRFRRNIDRHLEWAAELTEILEKITKFDPNAMVLKNETQEEKAFCDMRVCWGGAHTSWQGHANPDFGLIPKVGTDGLREKIRQYRNTNPGKDIFYDSLMIALEALDIWAERYRLLALELAEAAPEGDKPRLLRMAKALETVPKKPARDLFEAFQSFWLLFCMDGIDSPGRFDQYMISYYAAADEAQRQYCLEGLWHLFHETRTWNLCISGSDENGKDQSNLLTYDILRVARKYKYNTPNLTMRVHKNTPQALWESAMETLATGIGMPALYNDDCVCPALEALRISKAHAHNYCMNGCNQIDIFGVSHMGLEDGEVCLAKCLELALYNGVCGYSGEKISISTGDPSEMVSFEDFMAAYKKQVEYASDLAVAMANRTQEIAAVYGVNPLRSNLIEGCIEKGLDYKNGGPVYGHGQILAEGLADTADSLAAVKHFVFDEKKYTFRELIDALKANFQGYEKLYQDFSTFRKFGNDDPYVDAIYKEIVEHFYGYLLTKPTVRGGYYGGGCSTFNRTATYGEKIGALPNGKTRESTILADSIGAVPGCDRKGPTALINSVLSADQILAKSGNVLQVKFSKELFSTAVGKQAVTALAKTYFAEKGQQLTINVVSLEDLLDAQIHPEAHGDLIVRVGGYSDYFVKLSAGLQENIIKRTSLDL